MNLLLFPRKMVMPMLWSWKSRSMLLMKANFLMERRFRLRLPLSFLTNINLVPCWEIPHAFNEGKFIDGTPIQAPLTPFRYGVAGYPEKHEESPNMEQDLYWLKKKVEAGADYVVTQMFYDNRKYVDFVERARKEGINVPIVPGIKPFSKLSQLSVIPKHSMWIYHRNWLWKQ